MRRRSTRGPDCTVTRASDLAQMGRCERLVVLEAMHGTQRDDVQEMARLRGIAAHARFETVGRQALAVSGGSVRRQGDRCFIATLAFGDAWQTDVLRDFRDAVLRRRRWGRRLVVAYYRHGPRICCVLRRSPTLLRMTRCILGWAAQGWLRWSAGHRQ
jgi:hypothetical protein